MSEKRLSLTPTGNIRYQLKTPFRDGTTHVIFQPLDFIARRAAVTPGKRGKGATAGALVLIEPTTRPTPPAPTLTGQAGKRPA